MFGKVFHELTGYGVKQKFVRNRSDDLQVNKLSSLC